jgi:hypothetical protein
MLADTPDLQWRRRGISAEGSEFCIKHKMGANQSARKITVVNDEATGVIKISDAVVQRLKGTTVVNKQVGYLT